MATDTDEGTHSSNPDREDAAAVRQRANTWRKREGISDEEQAEAEEEWSQQCGIWE